MRLYENREFFFSYIVRYLPLPMDIASMLVGLPADSLPEGFFRLAACWDLCRR